MRPPNFYYHSAADLVRTVNAESKARAFDVRNTAMVKNENTPAEQMFSAPEALADMIRDSARPCWPRRR